MSGRPMTGDAHLRNAAGTLRDILMRRQPEYRWEVEVLPRRDRSADGSAPTTDRPRAPRPTDVGIRGGSDDGAA